jgi:hypothetical protein
MSYGADTFQIVSSGGLCFSGVECSGFAVRDIVEYDVIIIFTELRENWLGIMLRILKRMNIDHRQQTLQGSFPTLNLKNRP